ncbi:PilZ domain-containing protein [Butyrivibrio sp. MC2013]|uniref:PilZ domain-containing protein n=1 Tax=Butyrivibrio sp. MC2013 TaxID=1280686 RepID=UPI0003FD9C68|nr:PilZ domain-containing protein [Butyrivibrio sp. MC2013]
MDLNDISTGTEITIYIQIMNVTIQAVCNAIGPLGEGLIVTQPRYRGVPLNQMEHFRFSITDSWNNRYDFRCALIRPVQKWNNRFYYMEGLEGMDMSELRHAARYPVGIEGVAHVGMEDDDRVLIYDISMRGFSIVALQRGAYKLGDTVEVTFRDNPNPHRITMQGEVVRIFVVGDFEACGCHITQMGTDVMSFITHVKEVYEKRKNAGNIYDENAGMSEASENGIFGEIYDSNNDSDHEYSHNKPALAKSRKDMSFLLNPASRGGDDSPKRHEETRIQSGDVGKTPAYSDRKPAVFTPVNIEDEFDDDIQELEDLDELLSSQKTDAQKGYTDTQGRYHF